ASACSVRLACGRREEALGGETGWRRGDGTQVETVVTLPAVFHRAAGGDFDALAGPARTGPGRHETAVARRWNRLADHGARRDFGRRRATETKASCTLSWQTRDVRAVTVGLARTTNASARAESSRTSARSTGATRASADTRAADPSRSADTESP